MIWILQILYFYVCAHCHENMCENIVAIVDIVNIVDIGDVVDIVDSVHIVDIVYIVDCWVCRIAGIHEIAT